MKIKEGFTLRQICGENIIIASGVENIDFNNLIRLNDSATSMWKAAYDAEEFTAEMLADKLVEEYDVAPEVALADVRTALNEWKEVGIVTR